MNKKMKIVFGITSVVLVAGVLLTTGHSTQVSASNPLDSYKAKLQDINKNPNKENVLYVLDGVSLTKQKLERSQATAQSLHEMVKDGKTADENEALSVIKTEIAIERESKHFGLTVTDDEVKAWVQESKKGFEQHANASDKQMMTNIISSMNLNEDQYWNDFMVTEGKKVLLKSKLLNHFNAGYQSTHKNSDPNEMAAAGEQYLKDISATVSVEKK